VELLFVKCGVMSIAFRVLESPRHAQGHFFTTGYTEIHGGNPSPKH
jgi:hypothetical protein